MDVDMYNAAVADGDSPMAASLESWLQRTVVRSG